MFATACSRHLIDMFCVWWLLCQDLKMFTCSVRVCVCLESLAESFVSCDQCALSNTPWCLCVHRKLLIPTPVYSISPFVFPFVAQTLTVVALVSPACKQPWTNRLMHVGVYWALVCSQPWGCTEVKDKLCFVIDHAVHCTLTVLHNWLANQFRNKSALSLHVQGQPHVSYQQLLVTSINIQCNCYKASKVKLFKK